MRTTLSPWQMRSVKTGEDAMKYVQVKQVTAAHAKGDTVTYRVPFPENVEGILIQTIRITSQQNLAFVVGLMDGPSDYSIYESLEQIRFVYDQINIPYKPSDKAIFVRILNKGDLTTKFEIDIRGVEVK